MELVHIHYRRRGKIKAAQFLLRCAGSGMVPGANENELSVSGRGMIDHTLIEIKSTWLVSIIPTCNVKHGQIDMLKIIIKPEAFPEIIKVWM